MKNRVLGLVLLALLSFFINACSVVTTLSFTERDIKDSPNLVENYSFSPYSRVGEEAFKGWMEFLISYNSESLKLNRYC
jgi:hypothetical protein